LHYTLPHAADDRGQERWFTVASAPFEGEVMITTRLTAPKGSTFKSALQALKIGDTIQADGPEGDFVVGDQSAPYVFIAGGIGITPFHSILKEADRAGVKLKATLIYGNRDKNIVFKDELDAFASRNPGLAVHYLVDPERINEESVKKLVPDLSVPLFYVSGPEPMVKAIAEMLEKIGVPKERLKLDDFPGYPAQ
jgi:ferredoxin-NADP reductase